MAQASLEDEAAARAFLAQPGPRAVVFAVNSLAPLALICSAEGCTVATCDANEDDGEEAALALGATSLPWVSLSLDGRSAGCAPHDVPKTLASLRGGSTDVRSSVRDAYAATATGGPGVLPGDVGDAKKRSAKLGYEGTELEEGADLGLGCGNPLIAARLQEGEVVLDLGSGAGVDCFAAAKQVGPQGRVIGVDMTPEMLQRARQTASAKGYATVSFRLGEIEHLPVGDGVVDCLISNCVINLSPDKPAVYREMNRVLRPGGRVSISDVLRTATIPEELRTAEAYACWVSGASAEDEIRTMLQNAGFEDIKITVKENGRDIVKDWIPGSGAENYVTSAYVTATKPRQAHGFRDGVFYGASAACCAPSSSAAACCPPPAPPVAAAPVAPAATGCCPPSGGSAKPAAWG